MRERYHCFDRCPSLPHDVECILVAGHRGPHANGTKAWTSEASAAKRDEVYRAQAQAAERAAHDARIIALGGTPPRGGLVGNRQQRRVGLRRGR